MIILIVVVFVVVVTVQLLVVSGPLINEREKELVSCHSFSHSR